MNSGSHFIGADGRQHVWRLMGEQRANANSMNRVPHGGSGVWCEQAQCDDNEQFISMM